MAKSHEGPLTNTAALPAEDIAQSILFLRGQRVILDRELAAIYGVTTKRLNEQVKRNVERFPGDFMFQLTLKRRRFQGRRLRP
jgi:ORF6N domain